MILKGAACIYLGWPWLKQLRPTENVEEPFVPMEVGAGYTSPTYRRNYFVKTVPINRAFNEFLETWRLGWYLQNVFFKLTTNIMMVSIMNY